MAIFNVQRLALHQNAVEFRQQFNGAIRTSLFATYDDVRRRAVLPRNLLHRHTATQPCLLRLNIAKNIFLSKNIKLYIKERLWIIFNSVKIIQKLFYLIYFWLLGSYGTR